MDTRCAVAGEIPSLRWPFESRLPTGGLRRSVIIRLRNPVSIFASGVRSASRERGGDSIAVDRHLLSAVPWRGGPQATCRAVTRRLEGKAPSLDELARALGARPGCSVRRPPEPSWHCPPRDSRPSTGGRRSPSSESTTGGRL